MKGRDRYPGLVDQGLTWLFRFGYGYGGVVSLRLSLLRKVCAERGEGVQSVVSNIEDALNFHLPELPVLRTWQFAFPKRSSANNFSVLG